MCHTNVICAFAAGNRHQMLHRRWVRATRKIKTQFKRSTHPFSTLRDAIHTRNVFIYICIVVIRIKWKQFNFKYTYARARSDIDMKRRRAHERKSFIVPIRVNSAHVRCCFICSVFSVHLFLRLESFMFYMGFCLKQLAPFCRVDIFP